MRSGLALALAVAAAVCSCSNSIRSDSPGETPSPSLAMFIRSSPPSTEIEEGKNEIHGLVLAEYWYNSRNGVVDVAPDAGTVVHWPPFSKAIRAPEVLFRIATNVAPGRVEVHEFPGGLGRNGEPLNAGSMTVCGADTAGSMCWIGSNETSIEVHLRPESETEHLVLYVEWFVPVQLRPKSAASNPVVSASWGFTIRE